MNKLEALASVGCISPEWFLSDHTPRHAKFYGLSSEVSFQQVFDEHRVLQAIQKVNFDDMHHTGTTKRALRAFAKTGDIAHVGERLLGVEDGMWLNCANDEVAGEKVYLDPLRPLSVAVISDMNDNHHASVMLGRPNKQKELVMFNGFTPEDYDAVVRGVERLRQAKLNGYLPHMESGLLKIYIPYTLGSEEYPYDPAEFRLSGPLEYTTVALDQGS